MGWALYYAKPALKVHPYFQILALFKSFRKRGASYSNHTRVAHNKCIKQHTSKQICSLSSLSYLCDDYRKQAILISKSCGDSNRCTPCRGKPDQHDTYAFHTSPRTSGICFLWAVPVRGNLSRFIDRFGKIPLLPRKRVPDTIYNMPADRSVGPYSISLPSQPMKQ
jgi:hypothetical protein